MKEFKLPELGEGVSEADVVSVFVSEGDTISKDQPLIEVESDKATVEVPSDVAGIVEKLHVSRGDTVEVGQLILTLAERGEGKTNGSEQASKSSPEDAAASSSSEPQTNDSRGAAGGDAAQRTPFVLPELGEGVDEATVVQVMVEVGDVLAKEQPVMELESDKATVEVPSPVEGRIVALHVKAGDAIGIGSIVLEVEGGASSEPSSKTKAQAGREGSEAGSQDQERKRAEPKPDAPAAPAQIGDHRVPDGAPVFAAPSVRMRARQLDVRLRDVPGSGPAGRITKEDVEGFAEARASRDKSARSAPTQPDAGAPAASRSSSAEADRRARAPDATTGRREKLPQIRRVIAERMTQSWQTIPHVTLYREVDITEVERRRQKHKDRAEARGAKMTITAILVRVCAAALRQFPRINASIDLEAREIVYHDGIHIGVAADTDRGLVVPVVRDAGQKSAIDVAVELAKLAAKARDGKLDREEMQGGTFSISNLGGLGIGFFTPIINPPEVAILGVGRAQTDMEERLRLPLSLSHDHRLVDGADGARFLDFLARVLEDPDAMMFEV
ncbi:MAG: 2-oxo acid dehydrogenase subunit E2 [Myxococcota bacterium]